MVLRRQSRDGCKKPSVGSSGAGAAGHRHIELTVDLIPPDQTKPTGPVVMVKILFHTGIVAILTVSSFKSSADKASEPTTQVLVDLPKERGRLRVDVAIEGAAQIGVLAGEALRFVA